MVGVRPLCTGAQHTSQVAHAATFFFGRVGSPTSWAGSRAQRVFSPCLGEVIACSDVTLVIPTLYKRFCPICKAGLAGVRRFAESRLCARCYLLQRRKRPLDASDVPRWIARQRGSCASAPLCRLLDHALCARGDFNLGHAKRRVSTNDKSLRHTLRAHPFVDLF